MTTITTTQTKVVFPAPPPTTNSLTNQQRTQLLRKTKKLEQLLGAAPHLIDHSGALPNDPVHVPLPSEPRRRSSVSTMTSQRSFDSFSSGSVASTHSSTSRLLSSSLERSGSTASRSSRRSSMLLKKVAPSPSQSHSPPSYETWSETKPPFLRIDTESDAERSYWTSTVGAGGSKRYTLALYTRDSDSEDTSPSCPSFNIRSASSSRKTKMDRLRRKLGHGVPIELVFPGAKDEDELEDDDDEEEEEEVTSDGSFELVTPPTSCEDLPGALGRSRKATSPKGIAKSRDSLLIHQVPRKSASPPPATPSQAPLPPVPAVLAVSKAPKGRPLSAILEGTDEQVYLETSLNARLGETLQVPEVIPSSARRRWSLRT